MRILYGNEFPHRLLDIRHELLAQGFKPPAFDEVAITNGHTEPSLIELYTYCPESRPVRVAAYAKGYGMQKYVAVKLLPERIVKGDLFLISKKNGDVMRRGDYVMDRNGATYVVSDILKPTSPMGASGMVELTDSNKAVGTHFPSFIDCFIVAI